MAPWRQQSISIRFSSYYVQLWSDSSTIRTISQKNNQGFVCACIIEAVTKRRKKLKKWKSLERPGYSGAFRNQRIAEWNEKYGVGNWRLGWWVNGRSIDFLGVCALYEDAYYWFLNENPSIVSLLCGEASEVYDDAESNVDSGLDYTKQKTAHTHIQDIAIRRSLLRLGNWFAGDKLIQIRDEVGEHSLSITLSPGRVPFHQPNWIYQPEIEGWWLPGSVEAFYQSNKFLQIKKEA